MATNVATWLAAREWGGVSKRDVARLYATPPPRLQLPVESLGSDESTTALLKQVVILGFTRAGDHLISYTCKEGVYRLQYWAFELHQPLRHLVDIHLFDLDPSGGEMTREFARRWVSGGLAAVEGAYSVVLKVCEPTSGDFLVVHALEEQPGILEDSFASTANHFAVLPHPRRVPWDADRAAASSARAAHFSYSHQHSRFSRPPRPFDPREALLSDGTLLLSDGSRLQLVKPKYLDLAEHRESSLWMESDTDKAYEINFAPHEMDFDDERDDAFLYHTLATDGTDDECHEGSPCDDEDEESVYDDEDEESVYDDEDEESVYDDEHEDGAYGDESLYCEESGDESVFDEEEEEEEEEEWEEEFYRAFVDNNNNEGDERAGVEVAEGGEVAVSTAATTRDANNGDAWREGGRSTAAGGALPANEVPVHLHVLLPVRTVFKAEPFMVSSLRPWLRRGYRLCDYELHTLQLVEPPGEASYAVLLLACALTLGEEALADLATLPGLRHSAALRKARADGAANRLIALIVRLQGYAEAAAWRTLQLPDGEPTLLNTLQMKTTRPTKKTSFESFFCEEAAELLRGVPAYVRTLRARMATPIQPDRLPHVLSNSSVQDTGESLKFIAHSRLPIRILGFGAQA